MALRTEEERRRVRYRRMLRPTLRYWRTVGLTLFISWHFFAVTIWLMPSSVIQTDALTLVRPYMTATGFMQGWNMFSPNPYTLDVYVVARIHYADGKVREWTFPRMERMSLWGRYQKERWRKYIEVAQTANYRFLWPGMARYAARENNIYPNDPPVSVDLVRHYRVILTPGVPIPNWRATSFDTERVTAEDLH
jgi:hypothetical protein